MNKRLHIVSFNVPLPANYGGVIDVFYRLRTLAEMGVEIHLHCFDYGRGPAKELERYCTSVHYYERRTGLRAVCSKRPYIVESRENEELINRLQSDNIPILLEGLHCCSVLEALSERGNRKIFVRAHNVEHDYYMGLAHAERRLWKRFYLYSDALKLRRYEQVLQRASAVFAITEADAKHFEQYGCCSVLMPAAHPFEQVVSQPGRGDYVLYHADLSVAENEQAVDYLAETIFSKSPYQFVVAGRNPSRRLAHRMELFSNVRLVANPEEGEMQRLIADAHVIMMVTNQATGLKLKLLNSLYAGRHCLVNSLMTAGTSLDELCCVVDSPKEQLSELKRLMRTPFSEEDIVYRQKVLDAGYSNRTGIARLVAEL